MTAANTREPWEAGRGLPLPEAYDPNRQPRSR